MYLCPSFLVVYPHSLKTDGCLLHLMVLFAGLNDLRCASERLSDTKSNLLFFQVTERPPAKVRAAKVLPDNGRHTPYFSTFNSFYYDAHTFVPQPIGRN